VKTKLKKVTIVAEKLLREKLIDLLRKHGATGWSIAAVEGEGSRSNRTSDFEGRNIHIDTIVAPHTADKIMDDIASNYFSDWAIITYSSDVEVLRGDKYLGS
jgi:nitrogen regulatory protein P-II 2